MTAKGEQQEFKREW